MRRVGFVDDYRAQRPAQALHSEIRHVALDAVAIGTAFRSPACD